MKNRPEPYTVAGLFNALEHHRLGCPQTVTAALEQLIEEGYVRLEDDHLLPTPRGEDVIFLCTTHFTEVLDLPFNVILEHMLDQVAGGRSPASKFWPLSTSVLRPQPTKLAGQHANPLRAI
jgi:DNA topoisomerase IA